MNETLSLRTFQALLFAALLVLALMPVQQAVAQVAQEAENLGDPKIAEMSLQGGSVSFAPLIGFGQMTLTVAGQGHSSILNFRSGETASFAPVDSKGYSLPDGTYNWEISVSPRPEDLDLRAFRAGSISADGRTSVAASAPSVPRQSGVFTIKNGSLVDSTLREPEPTRTLSAPVAAAPPSAAARRAEQTDHDGN